MTNEERDLIEKFVARVGGAATGGFQSVPATQPGMAPIDPEADRFIAQQFQTHPEARYRITQMAVVQEAALAEAANRIQRLQAELDAARQQAQQAQQGGGQSRGFFGGLFGGGASASQPQQPQGPWNQGSAPQQQYAQPQYAQPQYAQQNAVPPPPGVQPGMFQRGGSGFLGSALSTAAGVAGGVVAGNVLMDMFSGHGGMGGGMFGGGMGGGFAGGMPMPSETTVINNYGDAGQQGGGWDNASQGGGGVDPAWDNSSQGDAGGGGGWDDNSGGGFDAGGGGFDDTNV